MNLNRLDVHQPLTDVKYLLDQANVVSQTFVSSYNNLNIVSICLRNDSRLLTPLTFNLYEATSSATPVRTLAFSGGNVDEVDCTKLQFEPIDSSAGKTYVAEIKANPSFADPLNPKRSMSIEVAADNNYEQGTGYVDSKPLNADLHFKTFYRQDIKTIIKESASQLAHRLTLDPAFMIPYILIVLTILYLLIRRKAK